MSSCGPLVKDGWKIAKEQVIFYIDERYVWVDLKAEKPSQELLILLEVKTFEGTNSPVEYLESAGGQYVVYQTVLEYLEMKTPLFLAVTLNDQQGFLSETIAHEVIRKLGIRIMVFDPQSEEVVAWIP
jgi:hypothetical protein